MEKKHTILLLSCAIFAFIDAVRKYPIKLEENGYVDIIVSIQDNGEPHDIQDQLISNVSAMFQEGSQQLYHLTKKKFHFRRVTITLPPSWKPSMWPKTALTFNQGQIHVTKHVAPYVAYVMREKKENKQIERDCGIASEDGYMVIGKDIINEYIENVTDRKIAKILVHEFGHLRFGVYDEYPTERVFMVYEKDFQNYPTQCSANFKVKEIEDCQPSLRNNFCATFEGLSNESSHYASLMFRTMDQITEFCDNDPSNPNILHNRDAPTEQNKYCHSKSVWEVIKDHKDYKDVMLWEVTKDRQSYKGVNSTVKNLYGMYPPPNITINIVRRSVERAVFVFDISDSMTPCKITLMCQIAKERLIYRLNNVSFVGFVWFSTVAFVKTPQLLEIKKYWLPNDLEPLLPNNESAHGSTSIGAGILAALDLLKDTNEKGGEIYVVTDAHENTFPYLKAVFEKAKEAGVIIHFRMSLAGDPFHPSDLYTLAYITGGYVIEHFFCELSEEFLLLDEMDKLFYDPSIAFSMHNEIADIKEHTHVIKYVVANTPFNGSALMEKNLGRDTLFEFRPIRWEKSKISWTIISPNGTRYNESSPCNDGAHILSTHMCFVDFQPGVWHYEVKSKESVPVATLVQSKWSQQGKYAIMMTASWQQRNLVITDGPNNEEQAIVVDFHRGTPTYNPVIYAEVIAKVLTPAGRVVTLYPRDDGFGADYYSNNGIYIAHFYDFDKSGTYNLMVYGRGTKNTTVLKRARFIGKPWFETGPPELTGKFTRVSYGGQFRLKLDKKSEGYLYAPGGIIYLNLTRASYTNRTLEIKWEAVGAQLFTGTASFYDIRIADSYDSLREKRFKEQFRITQDMIVHGVNLTSPRPAGETEIVKIRLPSNISRGYITVYAATSYKNKTMYGGSGWIAHFDITKWKQYDVDVTSKHVQTTQPVESSQLPKSVHFSELPKPLQSSELPKPVQSSELPKLVQSSQLPKPVQSSQLPKPVQSSQSPEPIQSIATLNNTAKPETIFSPSPKPQGKLNIELILGLVIGCATLVTILIGSIVWLVKKKTVNLQEANENVVERGKNMESTTGMNTLELNEEASE